MKHQHDRPNHHSPHRPEKTKFRSRFKFTDKDHQYIHSKGIDTIRSHAVDFITTRLAPAFPKNDGKQTPVLPCNESPSKYFIKFTADIKTDP
ncbi:DUF4186 family protein [Desulfosarcina widdelii]|uniref:DUF4186 family protein n=1 Tax=Desulfosarcina widdelii TaxID=947919 RepID=UPI0012D2FDE8